MSLKVIFAVHASRIEPRLRHLAQTLAVYANDDGRDIYPGVTTLMQALGVKKSAVHANLKQLIEHGVLERDGYRRHTRRFRFNLDRLVEYEPGSAVTRQGSTSVDPSEGPQRIHAGGRNGPRRRTKESCAVEIRVHPGGIERHERQDLQEVTGAVAPDGARDERQGRTESSPETIPKAYFAIAGKAIDHSQRVDGSGDLSNCKEWFKRFCAEQHLPYDSETAGRTIEAQLQARDRARERLLTQLKTAGPKAMR